ncbi:MAG: type II CRISPR-associated endonuclease Cas1 [Nitrospinae bacterium]|nr:type II CRISPR-associated endonuclease Cas1 [Nitrospinota bacterium]
MTNRIIDVSDNANLHIIHSNLAVEKGGEVLSSIPLEDIAALVLSCPWLSVSHAVLSEVTSAGGIIVICDQKHQPAGMVMPLDSHFTQGERFKIQAGVSKPVQKRLWQKIVAAKIKAQSRLLFKLNNEDMGLFEIAGKVSSGDFGNREAMAAQRYWKALFKNDNNFRRDRDGEDQNRLLNYGYAILRATVARAVCASGLHPALGIHHHNKYDPFCLASDLMEPYRPLVDEAVACIFEKHGKTVPLSREIKERLLLPFTQTYGVKRESLTLFSHVSKTASSLVSIYSGEGKELYLPLLN